MSESSGPRYDANQDVMNASASLSNGLLTVNFTRPIIIIIWQNATAEDVSFDGCRFIGFAYGGIAESFVSPVNISGPMSIGLFDRQICLQTCQFSEGKNIIFILISNSLISFAFTHSDHEHIHYYNH